MVVWGALSIGKYNANCLTTTCNDFTKHEAVWDDKNRTQFNLGELMINNLLKARKQCAYVDFRSGWPTKAKVAGSTCSEATNLACVTQCESGKGIC